MPIYPEKNVIRRHGVLHCAAWKGSVMTLQSASMQKFSTAIYAGAARASNAKTGVFLSTLFNIRRDGTLQQRINLLPQIVHKVSDRAHDVSDICEHSPDVSHPAWSQEACKWGENARQGPNAALVVGGFDADVRQALEGLDEARPGVQPSGVVVPGVYGQADRAEPVGQGQIGRLG